MSFELDLPRPCSLCVHAPPQCWREKPWVLVTRSWPCSNGEQRIGLRSDIRLGSGWIIARRQDCVCLDKADAEGEDGDVRTWRRKAELAGKQAADSPLRVSRELRCFSAIEAKLTQSDSSWTSNGPRPGTASRIITSSSVTPPSGWQLYSNSMYRSFLTDPRNHVASRSSAAS